MCIRDRPNTLFWCHTQSCRHGLVCTNNSIFSIEYGYQIWHSIKGIFPIFCGLNSYFFCLLAPGTFYLSPFSFLFDQSELMVDSNIDDLICVALVEGMGAKGNHLVTADNSVYLFFTFDEIIPILFFQPKSVPAQPQPIISIGQGLIDFLNPVI